MRTQAESVMDRTMEMREGLGYRNDLYLGILNIHLPFLIRQIKFDGRRFVGTGRDRGEALSPSGGAHYNCHRRRLP